MSLFIETIKRIGEEIDNLCDCISEQFPINQLNKFTNKNLMFMIRMNTELSSDMFSYCTEDRKRTCPYNISQEIDVTRVNIGYDGCTRWFDCMSDDGGANVDVFLDNGVSTKIKQYADLIDLFYKNGF